jgi:hypothetical protein
LEKYRVRKDKSRTSPGQQDLWEDAKVHEREEVRCVAEKFIQANTIHPDTKKDSVPGIGFAKG